MNNLKNHKHTNYLTKSSVNLTNAQTTFQIQANSIDFNDYELTGCHLSEAENLLGKTAEQVKPFFNKYEIILKKYFFGLFFRRLHITTNMSGEITNYYTRIDLR